MRPVVLIAEDEPHIRRIFRMRLDRVGFDVREACDGEAALAELAALEPGARAVAVVDIMMPKMDGLTLIRHLRRDPATADLPVIIASAVRDEDLLAEARALGVRAVLVKPFRHEELIAAVERALAERDDLEAGA